jgi:hypothetical protein
MADIGVSRDEPGQWIPLEVLARDAEILLFPSLLPVSRLPPAEPRREADPAESPSPPLS